jgi:predicted GH43/DUF377 family glycosyl hydrolase
MFERSTLNPLTRPADVKPSRPDFDVIGAFNAGVTRFGDEVILLLRVAERPISLNDAVVHVPYHDETGELVLRPLQRSDTSYDFSDPRLIVNRQTGESLLTSVSHLRLARSTDGLHFTIDPKPWLTASSKYEAAGVEDARITRIEENGEVRYYVNYTAVSSYGIATALVSTTDFTSYEQHGIIFPPSNRDVAIFPQKINGQYVAYHRPMPGYFGSLNIWIATSPDLVRWGDHKVVVESQPDGWDAGRVGGGAPPLWTEEGWLSIYHAADRNQRYCLGAFLTAHDDPARVIKQAKQPILSPEAPYETEGFFSNVVFSCGALLDGDRLQIYYGASDETIALAETSVTDLLVSLSAV